jgi:hypothetical protein
MRTRTGHAVMISLIYFACPAYSVTIGHPKNYVCFECARLTQVKCSAGSPYQNWTFSDGLLKCKGSGKCLAGHDRYADLVRQLECDAGDPYQKMKIGKAHRLILGNQVRGVDYCLSLTAGGVQEFIPCNYDRTWYSQEVYFT